MASPIIAVYLCGRALGELMDWALVDMDDDHLMLVSVLRGKMRKLNRAEYSMVPQVADSSRNDSVYPAWWLKRLDTGEYTRLGRVKFADGVPQPFYLAARMTDAEQGIKSDAGAQWSVRKEEIERRRQYWLEQSVVLLKRRHRLWRRLGLAAVLLSFLLPFLLVFLPPLSLFVPESEVVADDSPVVLWSFVSSGWDVWLFFGGVGCVVQHFVSLVGLRERVMQLGWWFTILESKS